MYWGTKKVNLSHLSIPPIIHHPPKPLSLHSEQPFFMVHLSNVDLLLSPYTHHFLPRPNRKYMGTREVQSYQRNSKIQGIEPLQWPAFNSVIMKTLIPNTPSEAMFNYRVTIFMNIQSWQYSFHILLFQLYIPYIKSFFNLICLYHF